MIRTCAKCGQQNRISADHLADRGRCGRCKAAIDSLAEPLEVGPQEFDEIVRGAKVPVLVDFWAEWCGPCKLAATHVQRVAHDAAGRGLVLKVNTEAHPDLAQRFGVRGIPNFVVLRRGSVVMQQTGLVDHRQMQSWLESAARESAART